MGGEPGVRSQESGDGGTATANDTFRIDRLTLKNFRCFEEKTIDFHPRFNVLIGDNGSGKTAVLEALAAAIGRLSVPGEGTQRQILDDDVRRVPLGIAQVHRVKVGYPAFLACAAMVRGTATSWETQLNAPKTSAIIRKSASVAQAFSPWREPDAVMPVLAYYPSARYSAPPVDSVEDFIEAEGELRTYGYAGCLSAAVSETYAVKWIRHYQAVQDQEHRAVPELDVVTAAIGNCIEAYRGLKYWFRPGELCIYQADGPGLPLRMLPAGVRSVLAMVADTAWRAFHLNHELFDADAAKLTPGVVLIDEIDLHLHPKWQRHVVDDLKRAFPKVQFIVTTHSPLIIQSLDEGELIALDESPPGKYADQPIEDILENVQDLEDVMPPPRKRAMIEAAKRYYEVLDAAADASPEEQEQAKKELDRLAAPFSDNVAYHASLAYLESKREAAGLGDGDE